MKQQPVLANFSSHVFATAHRRFQAGMRRLRESLAGESLSGYSVMFADVLPAAFLKRIDPTRRNRHFGHIPVFWAWLAQVLEGNASCSKAIGFVQSWCRSQGLPVPSSDTSSYCKARCRLSDAFLGEVAQRVGDSLARGQQEADLWHGFTLKAVDGTTAKLADTEENQKRFPQPSGQDPGCGFPVMGIAGLLNLSHGGWEAMTTGAFTEHDLPLAKGLLDHIGKGDLLLADRAFCSYAYIAAVLANGGHVVMRLHQQRDAALDWRKGRKILLRLLMQRAAREAGEPVGSISFKEALDLTTSIHESFRACAGKPRKRADQMSFLIEMMSTRVIDHRPGRREPRAVKRRPKPFPLLNKPRHAFVEVPHRSRYRKVA